MKRILGLLTLAGCSVTQGQPADLPPLTTVPATTTTTTSSTTTTTTSTTTTTFPDLSGVDFKAMAREAHGVCGEWYETAKLAGFTDEEWDTLKIIIARETGNTCRPDLINDTPSTGDWSFGLTQINMRGKLAPNRMLHCNLQHPYDLLEPLTNLKCAHLLYTWSGWKPWRM
jgi:hypothetical protein